MKQKSLLFMSVGLSALLAGLGAGPAGAAVGASHATHGTSVVVPPIVGVTPHNDAPSGLPLISSNWSGYAATGKGNFTSAHSRFVQPAIVCTGAPHMNVSVWVGLDGFTSGTVEQQGTNAGCTGKKHTTATYTAWFELYPAASVNVFKVKPGDVIDTTTSWAGGKFTLALRDLTSNKSFSHTASCAACERSSAEWIIERPAECQGSGVSNCVLDALPQFGTVTMTKDTASTGGAAEPVSAFTYYPISMIQHLPKGFISLDTAGPLSAAGSSFTATWDRSGKPVPITL